MTTPPATTNPAARRLGEALPGKPAMVTLHWPDTPAFSLTDREIILRRLGTSVTGVVALDDGSTDEKILGPGVSGDEEALWAATGPGGSVIAVVALDRDGPAARGGRSLDVRLHRYGSVQAWPRLEVGLDSRAFESLRAMVAAEGKEAPSRGTAHERAIEVLRRRLLLPAAPGGATPRLIALAAPGQDLARPQACALRSARLQAALVHTPGGWRLRGIHHPRQELTAERAAVVHCELHLYDASPNAELRRGMREEVQRLRAADAHETFLGLWQEYHRLDNRQALRQVRELGFVPYSSHRYVEGEKDVVRFQVSTAGDREVSLVYSLAGMVSPEKVDIEASDALPTVFGGSGEKQRPAANSDQDRDETDDDEGGLLDHKPGGGQPVIGNPRGGVDPGSGYLDLRLIRPDSDDLSSPAPLEIPPTGYLHLAYRGYFRQLQRRQRAFDRVLREQIRIPQLLKIIEGRPVTGERRGPYLEPMSDAVRARYPDLDASQQAAIAAALNTPDLAVIQGPPGTGKTEVIAALQIRLGEEAKRRSASRSILLASVQHAAVDEMVGRTFVYGLPAVKVDRRNRGSTAHIDGWHRATVEALRRELPETPGGRLAAVVTTVARAAAGYAVSPPQPAPLAAELAALAREVTGLVPYGLVHRLEDLAREIAAVATRGATRPAHRDAALRAVRGLRCLPGSFADDGPDLAARAAERLRRVPEAAGRLAVIERAADWPAGGPPPFLDELRATRDELLELLTTRSEPPAQPRRVDDVLVILDEVIAELDGRLRESEHGVDIVLREYLDDLEGDPRAVHATLRAYTASLGTTCQQADSPQLREVKESDNEFDTVIVDEAARANPLDLIIPLALARERIILVGDHRQLPQMLEPDVERGLPTDWRERLRATLFERLHQTLAPDGRAVTLGRQYRMHPDLGKFVSRHFYDGHLDSPTGPEKYAYNLPGYSGQPAAWLDVPYTAGPEEGRPSRRRRAEADAIVAELAVLVPEGAGLKFAVICFYRDQADLVRGRLADEPQLKARLVAPGARDRDEEAKDVSTVRVGTVDEFQGAQADVVFLSLVRSRPVEKIGSSGSDLGQAYGHLMLPNRLCVAMSRQKRLLVAVGDQAMFAQRGQPAAGFRPPAAVAPITDFHRLCERYGTVFGHRPAARARRTGGP